MITKEIYLKWHGISRKKAETLTDAWEKTLAKWGYDAMNHVSFYTTPSTCGLCDLFWDQDCKDCPVFEVTQKNLCARFKAFNEMRDLTVTNNIEEIRQAGYQELLEIKRKSEEK